MKPMTKRSVPTRYDTQVLCRALRGHAWAPLGAIGVLPDGRERALWVCLRCETERADVMKSLNDIRHNYWRPTDYASYLSEHTRNDAWKEILAATARTKVTPEELRRKGKGGRQKNQRKKAG